MPSHQIKVTKEFLKAQRKSIFWIIIFILTIVFSSILSVAILGICLYLAVEILTIKFILLTIIGAIGIIIMGGLIVYFNCKFILNIFKPYEEFGYEIKDDDYPSLFKLIDETADEVGTHRPVKVFLIEEINASVRYSNPLKSLILPTKKNLNIGIGLLNSVSVDELKGILAHEFGHFSQKSMTISSYVGLVNRIIYDLLYNEKSVNELTEDLAHFNQFVALISKGAIVYTKLIKCVLELIYKNLDLNYKALSKEMEYHADEIAVLLVGKETFSAPLIRTEFMNDVYDQVKSFYHTHKEEKLFTQNIYQNFRQIIDLETQNKHFKQINGIPILKLNEYNPIKHKIEVEDVWSTHPETKQRIEKIEALNVHSTQDSYTRATSLIPNIEEFEIRCTEDYFISSDVIRRNEIHDQDFILKYKSDFEEYRYPRAFNQFFENISIDYRKILDETIPTCEETLGIEHLFNNQRLDKLQELGALNQDIHTLQYLMNQKEIKNFKYEGNVYHVKKDGLNIQHLLAKEQEKLEQIAEKIEIEIIQFLKQNLNDENRLFLDELLEFTNTANENLSFINLVQNNLDWAYKEVHETIRKEGLKDLNEKNEILKSKLNNLLQYPYITKFYEEEVIENLHQYIENEQYFYLEGYNIDAFNHFFNALNMLELMANTIHFDLTNKYLKSNIKKHQNAFSI